jgi:hypothetical protein
MPIPAMLATYSGDVGHPPERSDAGLFLSSLTWPTSVKKNNSGIKKHHHLLSISGGNLDKVGLSWSGHSRAPGLIVMDHFAAPELF